jgi:hypothetical protein
MKKHPGFAPFGFSGRQGQVQLGKRHYGNGTTRTAGV